MLWRIVAIPIFCITSLVAQITLTELRLRVEPESRKIRPLETAIVQVMAFGSLTDSRSGTRTGRVQRDGWTAKIGQPNGGWVSKPFKYQGNDQADFLQTRTSAFSQLLGKNLGQYTIKDALLYTAPETPGKYTLAFELEGKKVETTIEVAADAPSQRVDETQTFPDEQPSTDPYRKLAEHYAPFVAQETWFQPKSDFLARFDYDGDWRGDNNWDDLDKGSSQAYVHYTAVETSTHVFLEYNFFHPRDYSDNCVVGTCHENDNEGIILTVQKDGSEFGRLQAVETLAHNNVYTYVNDAGLRDGLHDIDGPVIFWNDSHPMIFLEAGGHGSYSAGDEKRSLYSVKNAKFSNTGLTYVFKGKAERPKSACDKEVGYDLLPIYDQWWLKSSSQDWKEPTFDDYFDYQPFGNRPRMKNTHISGAFLGRKQSENKARPFWGWFDTRGRKSGVTNTGQWALDPAYSISKHVTFPNQQRLSLDYTYNPYLDIETQTARASMEAPPGFVPAAPMPAGSAGTPAAPGLSGGAVTLRGAAGAALGQVLGDNSALGAAMQRLGIGTGGTDALKHVGGGPAAGTPPAVQPAKTDAVPQTEPPPETAPQCTLSATLPAPGDIVIRGDQAEAPAGVVPKLTCTAAMPQSAVMLVIEMKTGAGARVVELPTQSNNFAARLRFDQPGNYELVVRWQPQ